MLGQRAEIFAMQNRYEKCVAELRRQIEVTPNDFYPRVYIVHARAATNDWNELETARASLRSDFAGVADPLVTLWLALLGPPQANLNWNEKLELVDGYREKMPDDADVALLQGAILVRNKDFERAEQVLALVLDKASSPRIIASTQLWLSEAKLQLAKTDEAQRLRNSAEAWIAQWCSLDIAAENILNSPTSDNEPLNWLQRVELHDWLAHTGPSR